LASLFLVSAHRSCAGKGDVKRLLFGVVAAAAAVCCWKILAVLLLGMMHMLNNMVYIAVEIISKILTRHVGRQNFKVLGN